MTDEELLKRASQGDEGAFLELYQRHRESVVRSAYRVLGRVEPVEDITQEVFMSLFKNPDRFDPTRASLRSYLIAAARNLALYHLRKISRENQYDQLPEEQQPAAEKGQLNEMLDEEMSDAISKAIDKLPPLYRNTIILHFGGHKVADIAEMQGTNTSTVKTRLLRAREQVMKFLTPYVSLMSK